MESKYKSFDELPLMLSVAQAAQGHKLASQALLRRSKLLLPKSGKQFGPPRFIRSRLRFGGDARHAPRVSESINLLLHTKRKTPRKRCLSFC